MASSVIAASSALLGSLLGGFASYFSTKSMRKLEWRLAQVERNIEKRESLYAAFLGDANRFMILTLEKKIDSVAQLETLITYESRIRLTSPALGDIAREITACVLDHQGNNKEVKREYPKLRDEFIQRCRAELDHLISTLD